MCPVHSLKKRGTVAPLNLYLLYIQSIVRKNGAFASLLSIYVKALQQFVSWQFTVLSVFDKVKNQTARLKEVEFLPKNLHLLKNTICLNLLR